MGFFFARIYFLILTNRSEMNLGESGWVTEKYQSAFIFLSPKSYLFHSCKI